jgi:hypothetical protein
VREKHWRTSEVFCAMACGCVLARAHSKVSETSAMIQRLSRFVEQVRRGDGKICVGLRRSGGARQRGGRSSKRPVLLRSPATGKFTVTADTVIDRSKIPLAK